MATVARIVEEIIENKPFLQEALAKGIVNNAALAEELRPDVERALKTKIKFSAVNMAIRRLSEKLEKNAPKKMGFDKTSDITIKSDLVEITLHKTKDFQNYLQNLYKIVELRGFLTITQGQHEVMIITNDKYIGEINDILPKASIKKVIKNLCSLTINIPPESTKTLGLFYLTTRALTWENIRIVDIVSTLTEMTFIVHEEDTSKAFDTLRKVINS
jgi:aspartokinase